MKKDLLVNEIYKISNSPTTTHDNYDDKGNFLQIHSVDKNNSHPQLINISLLVISHPVRMELDTVSAATLKSIRCGEATSNKRSFKTYDQGIIKPLGEVMVGVKYKTTNKLLKPFIVDGEYNNLFGRDWIHHLVILPDTINSVSTTEGFTNLKEILHIYEHLFTDQIDPVKNYEYNNQLKENVIPHFLKPRSVPFVYNHELRKKYIV